MGIEYLALGSEIGFVLPIPLDKILVENHQSVVEGAPIGIEGATGQAGHRHLHWSLQKLPCSEESDCLSKIAWDGESVPFQFRALVNGVERTVDTETFSCPHANIGEAKNQPRLRGPSSEMKEQRPAVILKLAKNENVADLSRWQLNENKIEFNGTLMKGDCDLFSRMEDSSIKTLVVNSSGGDAFVGLCIGRKMQKLKFDKVIVNGICVSSCANYLFLAAKQKAIEFGLVGYHGNITAVLEKDPNNDSLRKQLAEAKVDPKEIERIASAFTKEQRLNSALEQEFLKDAGVSQELFKVTQRSDKGLDDGKDYTFLLPTTETFNKYGIYVDGLQNYNLGQAMGMENILR